MRTHVLKASFIAVLPLVSGVVYAQAIDGFISNQIQNQISRQISSGISKNLSENLLIPMLKIRNESGEVKDFSLSSDERYYNLLHQDGTIRVWDSKQGVQRPTILPLGKRFTKVVSSSSAGIVCVGGKEGRINVFDILTARPVTELVGISGEEVMAMSVSKADNKLAAAFSDGTIIVWDLNGYQSIARLNTRHEGDLTRISFADSDKSLLVAGEGGFAELWSLEQAKKTVSWPKQSGDALGAWESNAGDLLYVDSEGNLQWLEQQRTRSGSSARRNKKLDAGDDLVSVAVSFTANLLALTTDANQIKLFTLNDLFLTKQIVTTEPISHLQFINQGKQLVGADPKGVLHVWDSGMGSELLKLISTDKGWTVVDNSGRFDSSEAGMPNVSWVAANKDLPIDSFSANYYEPGLLSTHLTQENFINQPPRKVQEGITLPPDLSLSVPAKGSVNDEIEVSFVMIDAGGGIGDHRLYQNGKIVDKSLMEDSSDSEVNGKLQRKVSYNAILTAGQNTFKVVAANVMGIDSQPQQQIVQVGGAETPAKLHLVAIGIDKYSDSKLNLAYSVADAKAIESTLDATNKAIFREVITYDLLDQNATKSAIVDKLGQIAENSQNDVLVIYFAGHGIAMKGEWYFLPYETRLPISESYVSRVGVSAKQIQDLLAKIPVQKVLVMIDSCYSGAGLSALQNLQNTQRHFSRALSKTVGVVVLTATRQDQEALELDELGHGLFTYVTNQGLQGAADLSPRDQKISAHELVLYSTETIPTFAKKYSAASQEPSAFTIGEDFVLLKP